MQSESGPVAVLTMPLGNEEICLILPQRYPFLLVDRIVEWEPRRRCVGIKTVTTNEGYFQGHFPGHPVMPGVLIIEALAQIAGLLTRESPTAAANGFYLATIDSVRFRQSVKPGDQLVLEATVQESSEDHCKIGVIGRVDNAIVTEGSYTFAATDNAA
jgi:beta-hydroxyacyl-ACP dehydratase FabZ